MCCKLQGNEFKSHGQLGFIDPLLHQSVLPQEKSGVISLVLRSHTHGTTCGWVRVEGNIACPKCGCRHAGFMLHNEWVNAPNVSTNEADLDVYCAVVRDPVRKSLSAHVEQNSRP